MSFRTLLLSALMLLLPMHSVLSADRPAQGLSAEYLKAREALVMKQLVVENFEKTLKTQLQPAQRSVSLGRLLAALADVSALELRLVNDPSAPKDEVQRHHQSFQSLHKKVVYYSSELIQKFPKDAFTPRAYYLRARAQRELGNKAQAIEDYKKVVESQALGESTVVAGLALAELFTENKNHQATIYYLLKCKVSPQTAQYPLVQDHLAWAYHYQGDEASAIRQLKAEIDFYRRQRIQGAADKPIMEVEGALEAFTNFWASGLEKRATGFTVRELATYLRSMSGWYPRAYQHGLRQFALNLATKNLDVELEQVAQEANVAANASAAQRALYYDIRFIILEHQYNMRQYVAFQSSLKHILSIQGAQPGEQSLQNSLSERRKALFAQVAAEMQKNFEATQDPKEKTTYGQSLLPLYQILLRLTEGKPDKQAPYYFNSGEIYLRLGQFERAIEYFSRLQGMAAVPDDIRKQARFKAVVARYEVLKLKGYFSAKNAQALRDADKKDVEEWVGWVDSLSSLKSPTLQSALEHYQFEAARIMLSYKPADAQGRYLALIKKNPQGALAIPASSIAVDFLVQSARWDEVVTLSEELLKLQVGRGAENEKFNISLRQLRDSALVKSIESDFQKKDYVQVQMRVDRWLTGGQGGSKNNALLQLAGNAAIQSGDRPKGLAYFQRMTVDQSQPETSATILLARGADAEAKLDFKKASDNYRQVFALPDKAWPKSAEDSEALRQKTLLHAWLSGDQTLLQAAIKEPGICGSRAPAPMAGTCTKYRALSLLMGPAKAEPIATAKTAPETAKLIYLALALPTLESMSYLDRMFLLKTVAQDWTKQDSLLRMELLGRFSADLPKAIALCRRDIKKAEALKLDKNLISRRLARLKSFEDDLTQLATLGWLKLRAAINSELALAYRELVEEILAFAPPKGLLEKDVQVFKDSLKEMVQPFIGKAKTLEEAAFELAQAGPAENVQLRQIAQQYLLSHPAAQAEINSSVLTAPGLRVLISSEALLLPELQRLPNQASAAWAETVAQALKRRNWPQTAFLLEQSKTQQSISPGLLRFVTALSLDLAGLKAEAMTEFRASAKSLDQPLRGLTYGVLVSNFYVAGSRAELKKLFEEMGEEVPRGEDGAYFEAARKWAEASPEGESK